MQVRRLERSAAEVVLAAALADKFFHVLTNWDKYLAPMVSNTLGVTARTFMLGVGGVEIVAGLVVAFALARISADYSEW